ncbi:MAG: hypothetical protein KDB03_08490 [Planctomycetales bacterium]|nr:hypothetical protein [Planctomycetales bacterium]
MRLVPKTKQNRRIRNRISQLERLEVRRLLARDVAGIFNSDEVWSGTIRVTNDVVFNPGTKLTIEPGTIVKFDQGKMLDVRGILDAIGLASQPIVFTSSLDDTVGEDLTTDVGNPQRGDWEALYFNAGDAGVQLSHAEVRYAGRSNGPTSGSFVAAIGLAKGATHINDLLIDNIASTGVDIAGSDPQLDSVRVQHAGGIAFHQTLLAAPKFSQLVASDTAGNQVLVDGGNLAVSRTWDFGGLPAHLNTNLTISDSATLTILAGNVIKIPTGGIVNALSGTLKALGTAAQPVIFTSLTDDTAGGDSNNDDSATGPYPGSWESIYLTGPGNVLQHTEVRYAGDTDGNGTGGGQTPSIQINQTSLEPELQTTLSDVSIRSGYSNGINVLKGNPHLSNVHAQDNLGVAFYFELVTDPIVSGLTASGNKGDAIFVQAGNLTSDRTWNYGTLPVVLTGTLTINNSQFTIMPGTVVKVPIGGYIHSQTGTLKALGTATQPIIITSYLDDTVGGDSNADASASTPYPGTWESIYLQGPGNILENVEVRYSGDTDGNGTGGGQTPSIQIYHESSVPAEQTRLSNVRIKSGYSNALNVLAGNPILENIHVQGNLGVAYYFELDTNPNVSGLTASGNKGDAIFIQGGNLTSDRTWDYGVLPISLTTNLTINNSLEATTTLTIMPGTVVKIPRGDFIHSQTGTLLALGTAAQPIVFTSTSDDSLGGDSNADGATTVPYPGSWESIYLQGPGNVLENVEVRYSGDTDGNGIGGGQTPSIQIYHVGGEPNEQTRLSNVRIKSGYSNGLNVLDGNPTLENIHAQDNVGVAFYFELDTNPVVSGLTAQGNNGDAIFVQGGNLTSDRIWDYGTLPVVLTASLSINNSQTATSTLTIMPGTVVKVPRGDYIYAQSGTLKAMGTAEQPIVITSDLDDSVGGDSNADGTNSEPFAGAWESIYLQGPGNVLENVEVRFSGDTDGNGTGGGQTPSIQIYHESSVPEEQTRLSNVRIKSGYSNALNVLAGNPILENLHVQDNTGVAYYFELDTDPMVNGLTASGNRGGDAIYIQGGNLTADRTWNYGSLPISLTTNLSINNSLEATTTLTIMPGTVIKIGTGDYIVAESGALKALGTAAEPIVFTSTFDDSIGGDSNADGTSTVAFPGAWEAINVSDRKSVL